MANKTTNYDLTKPFESEFYDVEVQNGNMDKIDAQMKANADAIEALWDGQSGKADLVGGKIPTEQLPTMNYDEKGTAQSKVDEHNFDKTAHPEIRTVLAELDSRIAILELKSNTDVGGNTFNVTFTTLDGLIVTGVWNEALGRVEF